MRRVSKADFITIAEEFTKSKSIKLSGEMKSLLSFSYDNPQLLNKKVGIQISVDSNVDDVKRYLAAFLTSHLNARQRAIRLAPSGTQADPALDVVLESFADVSPSTLASISAKHRLSMAAENILGNLLEAYLASVLEPRGWLWCCGNIVRYVDFYRPGNPPRLLQIKNRSNSENSASSAVRDFMKVPIEKWHRIKSRDSAVTFWAQLPGNTSEQIASEQQFRKFIRAKGNLGR